MINPPWRLSAMAVIAALLVGACGTAATPASTSSQAAGATTGTTGAPLTGDIRLDGSSTVYPIAEAIAEEFQARNRGVRVTVGFSGTGGGFQKFCAGETDANNASRPIKQREELDALCTPKGVVPVELKVAIDGLTVAVNAANDFADCMTTGELRKIWDQGSTVQRWSEIRREWPNERIQLFGPGADSGTFDYFTEVINGTVDKSRSDYTQSEDDNALVTGVSGDRFALGYFGYAYYKENMSRLKAVQIDGGKGCVGPTEETINGGTYTPLSRPLFTYPSKQALARPEAAAFFRFFLSDVNAVLPDVGYIPLPDAQLRASRDALEAGLR